MQVLPHSEDRRPASWVACPQGLHSGRRSGVSSGCKIGLREHGDEDVGRNPTGLEVVSLLAQKHLIGEPKPPAVGQRASTNTPNRTTRGVTSCRSIIRRCCHGPAGSTVHLPQ